MASRLGLMIKQEEVDNRIRSVTNRLRVRGVDVGSYPDETRDRDLRAYQRQEHTADLLEACLDRLEELGGEKRAIVAESETGVTDWNAFTVKDLKGFAKERQIEVPSKINKPELVALLEQHEAEQSPADDSEESAEPEGGVESAEDDTDAERDGDEMEAASSTLDGLRIDPFKNQGDGAPSSGWGH